MPDFDDNPFSDPFADPSIQQVTQSGSGVSGLEDYNPFDGDAKSSSNKTVHGAAHPPPFSQIASQPPPVLLPTQDEPPAYKKSPQQTMTTEELQRRQEELEIKAKELERREQELLTATRDGRKNNWPPLPDKFCVQPCYYQDINVDIPLEFQRIVRYLYYVWLYHSSVLLANSVLGMALLFGLGKLFISLFGLSLLYFFLFTPLSYICWFRPIYDAFKEDKSFKFFVFFFVYSFQLIVAVVHAIGIPGLGTCGFIAAINVLELGNVSGYVFGSLMMLTAAAFALGGLADFILLTRVHRVYRSTGASFSKAQQEFTSNVLRNEHVQSAAADVASAAVRNQFSGTANAGSRY